MRTKAIVIQHLPVEEQVRLLFVKALVKGFAGRWHILETQDVTEAQKYGDDIEIILAWLRTDHTANIVDRREYRSFASYETNQS